MLCPCLDHFILLNNSPAITTAPRPRQGGRRRAHVVSPDMRHPKVQWTHTHFTGGAHILSRQVDAHFTMELRLLLTCTNTYSCWFGTGCCWKCLEGSTDQTDWCSKWYFHAVLYKFQIRVVNLTYSWFWYETLPDVSEWSLEVPKTPLWDLAAQAFLWGHYQGSTPCLYWHPNYAARERKSTFIPRPQRLKPG